MSAARRQIGVLGGGVMGETLIAGVRRADQADVWVAEKNSQRADYLKAQYAVHLGDVEEVVAQSEIVLVVVKPQDVPGLVAQMAPSVTEHTVIVSLAAGVPLAEIESAIDVSAPVLRVMPNTPALVAQGMFAVSSGSHVSGDQLKTVVELLAAFGQVVVVDEPMQDAVTAVSGSGPAYVFYLAEQMIAAGIEAGLTEGIARQLTVQTLVGSAALLASSHDAPEELRRKVTSPGGTTFAATQVFDQQGVAEGLRAGVLAAAARSVELSEPK